MQTPAANVAPRANRGNELVTIARRLLLLAAASCVSPLAAAQGDLNLLCSAPAAWCEAAAAAFLKKTGTRVKLAERSAEEAISLLAAERGDPKHDLWYAGTGDLHLRAGAMGLTETYRSPLLGDLHDWAQRQAEQARWRTVGIYAGVLAIGYNADVLAKKGLPDPKCWSDLGRPEYRGEVRMSNPATSRTAYAAVATLVQLFGEERGFELLRAIDRNIEAYPRSGVASIRAAARGEAAVAVTMLHDGATEIANGFPIRMVVPCEGTGFEIGSMSIVAGARNLANARRFYDLALTPEMQRIGSETRNFQTPSNDATPLPPGAPRIGDAKLIVHDFAKYAGDTERKRLLDKWEREVLAAPR